MASFFSILQDLIREVSDLARTTGDSVQLRGLKEGGSPGQAPVKVSSADFDWEWQDVKPAMALLVANEVDRLALTVEQATDVVVVQGDDNSAWTLVADGDPSDTNDWVRVAEPVETPFVANIAEATPNPIDIPTVDDDKATTHPSVVYIQEGWNGYPYWMAHTPWPPADRERPQLVASYDGVNWVGPNNGEVVSIDDSAVLADTDMLLMADGLTMICYYINPASEILYYKTSTNGLTWSAQQTAVVTGFSGTTGGSHASPAVVLEADGTYTMWCVDLDTSPNTVVRRTSADGFTWGAGTTCTIPTIIPDAVSEGIWHIDVVRVGTRYYMLANVFRTTTTLGLLWWESADGLTWTGGILATEDHCLPKTTDSWENTSYYRSTMVAKPGWPLKWDVWAVGISSVDEGGNNAGLGGDHRVGYFRDIEMPYEGQKAPKFIMPPVAIGNPTNLGAWFAANWLLGMRFTVNRGARYRYVSLEVGTSSGNIQVSVIRLRESLSTSVKGNIIATTGTIACPATGVANIDLGSTYLPPGDYLLALWCDNTTATFRHSIATDYAAGRLAAAAQQVGGWALGTEFSTTSWTGRYVSHMAIFQEA